MKLRLAYTGDIPEIAALIDLSVRRLQSNDYSPDQIEGALKGVFGVDSQLIADGTYFVLQTEQSAALIACGGWSKRKTLFGGDQAAVREPELLNPETDAAKIRAFFVHPDWVRRGIGTLLLDACEAAAQTAGFRRFEMGATLTGVPLYQARGYRAMEPVDVPLPNGCVLPIVRMSKTLP